MILQALVKRYADVGGEKPGWKKRATDFALNLDDDGNILACTPLEQLVGKKKQRRILSLPATETRTAGILAYFLSDNAGYILGIDAKGKGLEKREACATLHRNVLGGVGTEASIAILRFFEKMPLPLDLPETKNDCVLMVNGKYAFEDEKIRAAWENYCAKQASGTPIIDLVTGKQDTLMRLQGEINLRGVSMGKKPLISINAESFASYGSTAKDPAAQIGQYAAFAYVTALNDLLASNSHRKYLAQDTLVYWAEDGGEAEAEQFSWFNEPQEEDTEKLDAILGMYSAGKQITLGNCDLERTFYLLCLSPNAGRISIRFFLRDSFGNILLNNATHYAQMEIHSSRNEKFPCIPPWMLLSETTVKKSASDAAPLLGGQLLNAIVTGSRYPMTLYQAIHTRIRAGEDINRTKAAIIKAILIRNYNEREVTTVALNTETSNKPYILGRLFSVLEQLQSRASGGSLNTTIRERYFASACANPANVFPTLLKLSMHHAAKLDNAVFYEKLKTETLGKLDINEPFPQALDLEDQGKFILGYYHQTQSFFTKKQLQEETTND